MRLAANISLLFTDVPLLARPAAARLAGFAGIEVQFPYEAPVAAWRAALSTASLPLVLMNLPPGDWAKGERGIASLPDRRAAFRQSLELALTYATALQCPRLHCLAGLRQPALALDEQWDCYRENLRWAAQRLAPHGITLLLEVLNDRDVPGYLLHRSQDAYRLVEQLGEANVKFQFDAYHLAIVEGDLVANFHTHQNKIGHVQVADTPGRHEPGTGTIDFDGFFTALRQGGYDGWIGCEYLPQAGFGWRQRYGFSSKAPEKSFQPSASSKKGSEG